MLLTFRGILKSLVTCRLISQMDTPGVLGSHRELLTHLDAGFEGKPEALQGAEHRSGPRPRALVHQHVRHGVGAGRQLLGVWIEVSRREHAGVPVSDPLQRLNTHPLDSVSFECCIKIMGIWISEIQRRHAKGDATSVWPITRARGKSPVLRTRKLSFRTCYECNDHSRPSDSLQRFGISGMDRGKHWLIRLHSSTHIHPP